MGIAWWKNIEKSPEKSLEESGGCNLLMAIILLGAVCIDTCFGWYDNLFLATNEDDQIAIVVFVFGGIGYFMFCGMFDSYLSDIFFNPSDNFLGLPVDILYVKISQFLMALFYASRWFMMYPDDWNPVIYYMPVFYKYSLFTISNYIFVHLAQVGVSCYVLLRDRGFKFQKDQKSVICV